MIPTYLSPLANHLWQSTLFAAVAGLLTLAFRKHRAGVRYSLWFAASVKRLIPFSLLVAHGSQFEWRTAPAISPRGSHSPSNRSPSPSRRPLPERCPCLRPHPAG